MSELLKECPFCGSEASLELVGQMQESKNDIWGFYCTNKGCFMKDGTTALFIYKDEAQKQWNTRYSKYPLAPVSSTLDRLLDSRFDLAAEAEADLGEIEHKGEKVMVKIKVVRGECTHKNKVSAAGKGTPIVSGWYCPDCKCLFSEDMEDKVQITDTILSKEPK